MPFVRRSNEIWRDLEAQSGRRLFHESGGLIIGSDDSAAFHFQGDFVETSARIAAKFGIPHEVLSADEIIRRFPLLTPRPDERAYYEAGAGVLRPERCIETQLELARQAGTTIHTGARVIGYEADAGGVTVRTAAANYRADKLILAAGAWIGELLPEAHRGGIRVCRQLIHWFEAEDRSAFDPSCFPFVIWIGDTLEDFWSVFPAPPLDNGGLDGVKLVTEQYHTSTEPDAVDRVVTDEEKADMYQRLTRPRLKGLRDRSLHAEVCLYTLTRDEHFLIDFHPATERVVVTSPCSGHGFKHSAAVGETLMQLALDGGCEFDISAFNLARLNAAQT
jgi:sarcosine oxidase